MGRCNRAIGIFLTATWVGSGYAFGSPQESPISYTENISDLAPSLALPVRSEIVKIEMPIRNILTRINRWKQDDRVEPVQVFFKGSSSSIMKTAAELAKQNKIDSLFQYLKEAAIPDGSTGDEEKKKVLLSVKSLELVDLDALAHRYSKFHHQLTVDASAINTDKNLKSEFLSQIEPFISDTTLHRVEQALSVGESISVDRWLLPPFAQKMVKKFTIYRGPNCFHSALAFQNYDFAKSKRINLSKEDGHHGSMINYDELWFALDTQFYEVNPRASNLKYGDVLVFFERANPNEQGVYFRNIKHASAYLFGPYTFSKGSKSPNTPYTVKTIKEEWDTWSRIAKNMGVKVFRKKYNRVRKKPLRELDDWLY